MKKILVLCTGNSCRSIMMESLLNHYGAGKVQAFSAGSKPTGVVNPITLEVLANWHISTAGARSKSWDEFAGQQFDIVITVCDNAKGETCPVFTGAPVRVHWGVDDPARVEGPSSRMMPEHERVLALLEKKAKALLALDVEALSGQELVKALKTIV